MTIKDSFLSRKHLVIKNCSGKYIIEDCQSTNGTWLDGTAISSAPLYDDSLIEIGSQKITVLNTVRKPNDLVYYQFKGMIARSACMLKIFDRINSFSASLHPVLIMGESGTGKELVARALHERSHRGHHPFHAINCSSLPRELIEAELFGVEKGAYTGATHSRKGAFEIAHQGTLFLDEIGEMPLDQQAKLLRVLETGVVRKLGAETGNSFNDRFVAATNRDLIASVLCGRFREDLYHRLSTFTIQLQPLRNRAQDVAPLFYHLYGELKKNDTPNVDGDALKLLSSYGWPGNIRELKNLISRLALLHQERIITKDDIGRFLEESRGDAMRAGMMRQQSMQEIIDEENRRQGGSHKKTYQALGIPKSTYYYHLRKLRGKKADASSG